MIALVGPLIDDGASLVDASNPFSNEDFSAQSSVERHRRTTIGLLNKWCIFDRF